MRGAPTSSIGDRDLVEAVRHGETWAEDEFVVRYRNPLRALMLARTRSPEDAEDLVQDALLAVLRSLRQGHIASHERLAAFVQGTARNIANNYFRARDRMPPQVPLSEDLPAEPVESRLESEERMALALTALAPLRDLDRAILRMSLVDGLTPREIGRELHMRPALVRTQKSRAAHRLFAGIGALSRSHPPTG